ncbi:MAG: hypothetical protein WAM81_04595 [Acidimicrobiia bacterium]
MDFYVILVIAIGIFAAAAATNSRNAAAWTAAARVLGVTYTKKKAFSTAQLSGTVEGIDLSVSVRASGNAKATRYVVSYPALGIDLTITRKGGLNKLAEMFGGSEQSDDPFDQLVSIKTSDPQQLQLILTPQVRQEIADLLMSLPAAKVMDDQITFERRSLDRQVNTIVATSRRLVAAAHMISGQRRTPDANEPTPLPPDPFATSIPGPMPSPPPPSMQLPTDPTSTLDTTVPSYEAVTPSEYETMTPSSAAPSYDSAIPEYEPASSEIPMYEPSTSMEPSSVAPATPTPAGSPSAGELSPATVAEALFGGNLLSFEAATTFNEQYSGRRVQWTGTVTRRTETRIWSDVATIDTTLFGPIHIEVVVESTTPAHEGDLVVVDGTLSAVDSLERTFTVDGTVERR